MKTNMDVPINTNESPVTQPIIPLEKIEKEGGMEPIGQEGKNTEVGKTTDTENAIKIDALRGDLQNRGIDNQAMTEEAMKKKEAEVDARIKEQIAKEDKEKMSLREWAKYQLDGGIPLRMALSHMAKDRPQFIQAYRALLDEGDEQEAQNLLKMYAENPRGYVYRDEKTKLKDITVSSIGGGAPESGQ